VEFFRLEVILLQGSGEEAGIVLRVGEGEVCEDVLFLTLGEVPEYDNAIREYEHLGELLGFRCQTVHLGGPIISTLEWIARILVFWRWIVERHWNIPTPALVLWLGAFCVGVCIIVKVSFMMVAPFAPFDLEVQNRFARAGSLQNRPAAHTVAFCSVKQRQCIDDIEAIVVELGLCFMFLAQEFGGRLDFVGLRGAVCSDTADFFCPLHLGEALGVAFATDAATFPKDVNLLVLQRPLLIFL
jgi:hypothetical protein